MNSVSTATKGCCAISWHSASKSEVLVITHISAGCGAPALGSSAEAFEAVLFRRRSRLRLGESLAERAICNELSQIRIVVSGNEHEFWICGADIVQGAQLAQHGGAIGIDAWNDPGDEARTAAQVLNAAHDPGDVADEQILALSCLCVDQDRAG